MTEDSSTWRWTQTHTRAQLTEVQQKFALLLKTSKIFCCHSACYTVDVNSWVYLNLLLWLCSKRGKIEIF